jgi:glycosyltransferase involved in cell wall biosynthesis
LEARPSTTGSVLQVLQPLDGGVARHVSDLTRGLRARGWAVEVAASADCTVLPELEAVHVPVHRLEIPRAPGRADLSAALELRRLDHRRGFDIIHAHSSKAGAVVRVVMRPRARVVYTPHCFAFASEEFGRAGRVAARLIEQGLVPRTGALVAVSRWEARKARGLLGATARTTVIPNGTGPCQATLVDRELAAWKGDGPLAALVSKLRPQKDPLALVRAAAALERRGELSGRVALVGDGELEGAVRSEIERLGVTERVRLFPYRGESEAYLQAIDLLVVPSRWESLPIGVIEAMACGVPVLATAVGGLPELVRDGETGRLVPAGNPRALESELARLLANPDERARLGSAGRGRAQARFSIDGMVDATAALYRRLLGA